MRDKDGFLIQCKHCEWKIIDNQENQDYVCGIFGKQMIGYHVCFADEYCNRYEPDIREDDHE